MIKVQFQPLPEEVQSRVAVFLLDDSLNSYGLLAKLNHNIISKALSVDKSFIGKVGNITAIIAPNHPTLEVIILAGIGKMKGLNNLSLINIGSSIAAKLNNLKLQHADIYIEHLEDSPYKNAVEVASFISFGIQLRNYNFTKYFKAIQNNENSLRSIQCLLNNSQKAAKNFERFNILATAIYKARDLGNEPANVLYPESFAQICLELSNLNANVKVLYPQEMQELNMNSLLAVAQGSANPARLVVIEWFGNPKGREEAPISFVGKGVTFDTGGINLKSTQGIVDMKRDMCGAAAVYALMYSLIKRKAKVNAIGVLGLVENMPSASAQRPGDIVTSMSGQTIEVLNTDAEGRMVLADAMWYTQENYRPHLLIDIATLTGAIGVALGDQYAGLFSNNEQLAKNIIEVGKKTNELVWQLPLSDYYDSKINSDFADMRNTSKLHGLGGAITAAQFLQRFIKDKQQCKWAHLDIASVAAYNSSESGLKGCSGFGVYLLEQLVHDFYEE